jgi:flagellar hook-basal body complex protein FliE
MSIEPVSLTASLSAILPTNTPALDAFAPLAPVQQPAPGFGDMVARGIGSVNENLVKVDNEVRQVAAGAGPSLHEVMIHLEEARLSFQLLAQVRNRLLDAYQEVMRMQV